MEIIGRSATDIGNKRDNNEDFALVDEDLGLFVLCDGVGGHKAGEVASRLAAETIQAEFTKYRGMLGTTNPSDEDLVALEGHMRAAVVAACEAVYTKSRSSRDNAGMGTTCTAMLIVGNRGIMGHVGDSRLYLRRSEAVHVLSTDHTFVTELLAGGVLTPEQAKDSPYANLLTRALGKDRTVRVDTLVIEIMDGDEFVLCSDGFSNYLATDEELAELMEGGGLDTARSLVQVAYDRGGEDNITVITVRAQVAPSDTDELTRSSKVQIKLDVLQQVYLFRNLDMKELSKLMQLGNEVVYPRGAVIIREQEQFDRLVIVVVGAVSVHLEDTELARLGPGAHVGEMGFFTGRKSGATVVAENDCTCLEIPYDRLEAMMQAEPRIAYGLTRNICEQLAHRLDEANHRLVDVAPSTLIDIDPSLWI